MGLCYHKFDMVITKLLYYNKIIYTLGTNAYNILNRKPNQDTYIVFMNTSSFIRNNGIYIIMLC